MIKIDIANVLLQMRPISKSTALQVVDLLTDRMKKALLDGHRIELRGFGVFELRPRRRGIGRNIKTGQSVAIQKGKTIRFKPGKDLRNIDVEGFPQSVEPVHECTDPRGTLANGMGLTARAPAHGNSFPGSP